mmetsp:Transcript_52986/g.98043  ORF Transcript_52986/g.98043 Transcript_52986/m.98043 type:complete len:268 (+) Transcript_52986:94-897(+)
MAAPASETIQLSDGSSMSLARVPDVDDATWAEVKTYLQGNPDQAKNLQKFARNPEAMRGWLQTQAIAEHYGTKMNEKDEAVQQKLKALESDPELASIFEDIKKNGLEAAMKHTGNEELMLKISQKMGGLPKELDARFQKLQETPLTVHEAAKNGDLKSVQEYLTKKQPLDAQDVKGITPLGYAIGANRIAVVKLLLDNRANPFAVDSNGNSGLHYAAGYGRKELVEYLLKLGVSVNQANSQGQTPLSVATQNRHQDVVQILKARGAQ